MNDAVLDQQIAYYRARAREYDALLPPDPPPGLHLLRQLPPVQHVLELACGTGVWTRALLQIGQSITAVDAAPEMLDINARKVASPRVRYEQANLLTWEPEQQYDLVFMASWLSHVPPAAVDPFLSRVQRAVRPGGSLAIIDQYAPKGQEQLDDIYATRHLSDGRTFIIVKVFYAPAELEGKLTRLGFESVAHKLNNVWFFLLAYRNSEERGNVLP